MRGYRAQHAIIRDSKGLHLRDDGAAWPCGSPSIDLHGPRPLVLKHQIWPSRPCRFPAQVMSL